MLLQVNEISFGYLNHPVLEGISFSACRGDFVAIVGTNGVGKSTLLKNINRILKCRSGDILIQDKNVHYFPFFLLDLKIYLP